MGVPTVVSAAWSGVVRLLMESRQCAGLCLLPLLPLLRELGAGQPDEDANPPIGQPNNS